MGRIQRLLDQPLIMYLVIGTFSVVAAYLFWMIGGNFGKVVSDNHAIGVSFELGGAIAGFVSVFLVSLGTFKELHKLQPPLRRIKVFLTPRDQFPAQESYSCKVWIYDAEVGDERTLQLTPRREAGYLTIDLRDLRNTETFRIELCNSQNKSWQSEYYHVAAPRAEMQPI
jgi:hypothetical protein